MYVKNVEETISILTIVYPECREKTLELTSLLVDSDDRHVGSADGEAADLVYGDFEREAGFGQASFIAVLVVIVLVAVVPTGQDDRISIRHF